VRVKSDESGAVARTCDYGPYGDNESCSPADTYGSEVRYAGYERDQETGLDHMWFRYYNPRLGRFMSADPLSGSTSDPQSLNKFAYALNSPSNYMDSLGLCSTFAGPFYRTEDGESKAEFVCMDSMIGWAPGPYLSAIYDLNRLCSMMGIGCTGSGTTSPPAQSESAEWLLEFGRSFVEDFTLPTACGGGAFVYGGATEGIGPLHVEMLGVVAYDSETGGQHGGIVAAGAENVVFGFEAIRNWKDWSEHTVPIFLGGGSLPLSGKFKGKTGDVGGLVTIENGAVVIGAYSGATKGYRTGGGGGYVSLKAGTCH
jgi:RHS repeat-associated protein